MSPRATKLKNNFVCQACAHQSPKWLGRCPDCGAWNQMVEERQPAPAARSRSGPGPAAPPVQPHREIATSAHDRQATGLAELDRVLGGGVVPGSLILVGGDPGIGKSTLLLQAAFALAQAGRPVLYVSGEESPGQIKLRADRLGDPPANLSLLCETRVEEILAASEANRPAVVIIDSIQTLAHSEVASVPGSVSQIRECGAALLACAKNKGPAIFLVGHVTKEGVLAGPRVLEHMVDTVLYFEGDRQHGFRVLRTAKNRFGSTNEVGIFEMGGEGLREVTDPSRSFLQERRVGTAGSAIAVSLEGTRPLLVEVQCLTATSYFGLPQRRVSGLDYNRCCLLLAVLERRAGLTLGSQDVYFSVAGGLSVTEPAVDLAVAAAAASSLKDKIIDPETALFGEVGLSGEIRGVTQAPRRCQEARQLGFKRCLLPQAQADHLPPLPGLEIIGVNNIQDVLTILF